MRAVGRALPGATDAERRSSQSCLDAAPPSRVGLLRVGGHAPTPALRGGTAFTLPENPALRRSCSKRTLG